MPSILQLNRHNPKKELEFELKYLKSLSVSQRFKLMIKKTEEIVKLLEKSGHIKMKQAARRPKDLEDLKYLKKLRRK